MDLDRALATLPPTVRMCVVLSYNEGMSHREIAQVTEMPLGTVKTHIRNGALQLQQILSAYGGAGEVDTP
jgi:RNA polymerase sigma-70 factor (ECF subfamily)